MKIVCEVDYLEDNEPIIYGPYAQRDCLDYNEFVGNAKTGNERANEGIRSFPDAVKRCSQPMHKRNPKIRSQRGKDPLSRASNEHNYITYRYIFP